MCATQRKYLNNLNTVERAARTDSFAWRHADDISETRAAHNVDRSNAIRFVLWQKGHERFSIGSFMGTQKNTPPNHVNVNFSLLPQPSAREKCVCRSVDANYSKWMDIYPRKFEPWPFIFRELLPNLSVASGQRTPHSSCAWTASQPFVDHLSD